VAQGPRDYIDPNKYFPNSLQFMENSILQFLQALFANFPVGENCYHYNDSPDLTEIHIEGQSTDNLRTVDTRPKIVVARGPVSVNLAGINGKVGSANLSQRHTQRAAIRSGTVGVSCFSREELEADRLAEICADAIESFSPVIRKLGFLQIHAAQIGQRAIIRSDARPELSVTPVLVRVELTKNYTKEIVDPVQLRKLILQYLIQPVNMMVPGGSVP
jgi:hypothetical protein